jgi:hypothetical protein
MRDPVSVSVHPRPRATTVGQPSRVCFPFLGVYQSGVIVGQQVGRPREVAGISCQSGNKKHRCSNPLFLVIKSPPEQKSGLRFAPSGYEISRKWLRCRKRPRRPATAAGARGARERPVASQAAPRSPDRPELRRQTRWPAPAPFAGARWPPRGIFHEWPR